MNFVAGIHLHHAFFSKRLLHEGKHSDPGASGSVGRQEKVHIRESHQSLAVIMGIWSKEHQKETDQNFPIPGRYKMEHVQGFEGSVFLLVAFRGEFVFVDGHVIPEKRE